MTTERIKEIQELTAYPESTSVMLALKQVWNECEQNLGKENKELKEMLIRIKDFEFDTSWKNEIETLLKIK